jgi:branched-chain amino acid transport system substrate-binding protein
MRNGIRLTRRELGGLAAAGVLARPALAQAAPLRVGLMLPYSGTFAQLGENITSAFEMHLAERGGKLGGRAVTVVKLDDASDPAAAPGNVNRLLNRDKADVLVGTVHSGVVMALVQAAREKGVPLIIPNAGNVAASRRRGTCARKACSAPRSATGSRPMAWARRWPRRG